MKKKEFKVGDRVIVTDSRHNSKGQIVHVTKENYLIKFDDIIGTYNYSFLAKYQSDKKDLWWVKFHSIKHIEKSITKKELLKRIEALEVLAGVEKKTELEVGKWYFGNLDNERKTLFRFNGQYGQFTQCGFTVNRVWSNQIGCIEGLNYTLATTQEVEEGLIKEAKRRGLVEGATVKDQYNNTFKNINGSYVYRDNKLAYGGCLIFHNGKWAEVIKNDDKPKVGDVAKVWNDYENIFVISTIKEVKDLTRYQYPYKTISGSVYKNAKKLTEEEVIKLLFKYERF